MLLFILFIFLLQARAIICQSSQIQLPSKYLGDTPYQNQSFQSNNISTALRIQRDIASNVTLDHLLWPGVFLTTAYFGNDYSLEKINQVDQLLLMGYKELTVDIYWNDVDLIWQLCPVPIPKPTSTNVTNIFINNKYTCAVQSHSNLGNFMELINDYLVATDDSVDSKQTSIISLVLNLNQLENGSNSSSNNNSTVIPTANSQLGQIITNHISKATNLAPRLYTPLNLSQFISVNNNQSNQADITKAFQQQTNSNEQVWPHWIYLVQQQVQLLVSFGDVRLQPNSSYQLTTLDHQVIFPSNSIMNINNQSQVSQQTCKHNMPSAQWPFVNDVDNIFTYETAHQAVECGFSPYFTHSNYSDSLTFYSAVDSGHLADNVLSTIWSWDINEPKQASSGMDLFCAAMQKSNGRWRSYSCEIPLRVACRLVEDPYVWMITQDKYNYDGASDVCPQNYTFDVPRISIQNTLLHDVFLNDTTSSDELIWINLNLGFPAQDCWVIGKYGECWWLNQDGEEFLGLIKTSIVSGVIILVLVGFFTWVKCARLWRNRNSKGRKSMVKRMIARREYVTVPA